MVRTDFPIGVARDEVKAVQEEYGAIRTIVAKREPSCRRRDKGRHREEAGLGKHNDLVATRKRLRPVRTVALYFEKANGRFGPGKDFCQQFLG